MQLFDSVKISRSRATLLIGTALSVAVFCAVSATPAFAQGAMECGSLENAYGPYDYTNPVHRRDRLPIVEFAHLGPQTISLDRGTRSRANSSPQAKLRGLLGDLNYTLRTFPNHAIALDAMARVHLREGSEDLRFLESRVLYSMACWFDRAKRFKPDDHTVRMIHGIYLYRQGHFDKALDEYAVALQLAPDSAEVHYNTGLLYVKVDDLDAAQRHAKIAYDLGYPLPGLRNMLKRRGHWSAEAVSHSDTGSP